MGGPILNQSALCNCGFRAWERGSRQGVSSFIRIPCDVSHALQLRERAFNRARVGVGSSCVEVRLVTDWLRKRVALQVVTFYACTDAGGSANFCES